MTGLSLVAIYFASGPEVEELFEKVGLTALFLPFALLGIYMGVAVFKTKIVLRDDALERHGLFRTKIIAKSDIRGVRMYVVNGIKCLELVTTANKKIKIALLIRLDVAFFAWLDTLTDLDQEELDDSERELQKDPILGITPGERSENLLHARQVAKWLNRIGMAALLWGMFYPHPYDAAIALNSGLPLVVALIMMRSSGLYDIEGRPNDRRPSMAMPIFGPSIVLGLRAVLDLEFLGVAPILVWGGIIGVAGGLLILRFAAPRRSRFSSIVLLVFLAGYAGAAIAFADTMLDKGQPTAHPVVVRDKRISRDNATVYYLTVDAFDGSATESDLSVDQALYERVNPGESVCVYVFPGALKIPWMEVGLCAD
jgi:hypothetical protein